MLATAAATALTLLKVGLVTLLAIVVLVSTALSLYLLVLAAASLRRPRKVQRPVEPSTRFAILVPAYEEELVIGRLLVSINALDYPRELFTVHVIADHCTDRTADIARGLGAAVYERSDPEPRGKARSLNWLVRRLLAGGAGGNADAFVVLDADSIVSPNLLRVMEAHLRARHPLVQGLIQIDDPLNDKIGQLRALAYEFISHVRPLGRSALGLSAGLRGNGMGIARECAERFPWDPESLTEDYELHGRLLTAGLSVAFAPEAVVRTQLPQSRAVASTQSARWESGRIDAMRRHVPALIRYGVRERSWASIDGAIELLTPPFSILFAVTVALAGLSLLSGVTSLLVVALTGLLAQCLYTLRGLALASTHYPHIYRALLFVPIFVLWRLWLYIGVLARRGRVQWTRTLRTPNP